MTPAGPGQRVLIVEDNPDTAETLRVLLSLLGHQVRVARTGPEGVRAARAWSPGVVLCDIGLPGLDGFGVASELRQRAVTGQARLVAITAYSDDETRRKAAESGFDHFLVKPADPARIVELLAVPGPSVPFRSRE
jgi:two-component system CheB/CheR fusion protein